MSHDDTARSSRLMSQQLASEISKAVHLLESLTKHSPPERPLGELNPKCLRDCKVSSTDEVLQINDACLSCSKVSQLLRMSYSDLLVDRLETLAVYILEAGFLCRELSSIIQPKSALECR